MATYYRTGVETYSIIGTASERDSLEGRIPDGSTYFAVDENMFYTFYDGQWYETLPEAARLYHDDVGTDTKPIKLVGGVATVVANELAEDSKVVHLAGTETITGDKTFSAITNHRMNIATICMVSTQESTTSSWKMDLQVHDQKNGANLLQSRIAAGTYPAGGFEFITIAVRNPSRTAGYAMDIRSYEDHMLVAVPAYYPVDGQGNPTYLTTNALMASGNIAVDPRLVHTTGVETIAGAKTFTGDVVVPTYTGSDTDRAVNKAMLASHLANDSTLVHTTGNETIAGEKTFNNKCYFKLAPVIQSQQAWCDVQIASKAFSNYIESRKYDANYSLYDQHFFLGNHYNTDSSVWLRLSAFAPRTTFGDTNETQAYIALMERVGNNDKGDVYFNFRKTDGSVLTQSFLLYDGGFSMVAPTYTADNNADDKIVTRSMLVQTPTVVHTTGNETVAGNKSFNGTVSVDDLRRSKSTIVMTAGNWAKMYEFTPAQLGSGAMINVYNDYGMANFNDKVGVVVGNRPTFTMYCKTNIASSFDFKMAKRSSDGVVEVWIHNNGSNVQVSMQVENLRNITLTVNPALGEEPVTGDTYSEVVNSTVVS